MIEGATYIFNKDQVKVAGPTNFGWEKITLVERRITSTETFEKMKPNADDLPDWEQGAEKATLNLKTGVITARAEDGGAPPNSHKVTRNNYEWVVFTHSDQGYVTVDQDLFEDETGMGIYELWNWRELRDNPAIYNLVEV